MAWINGARKQNEKVYQFDAEKIPAHLTEQLTSIRDFLYSTEKWHEELAQNSKKRPVEILNESLKDVEAVLEIDNNLTLYRLKTPEALDFESK